MSWWVLVPVVTMISGPVTYYLMNRRRRQADENAELRRRHAARPLETGAGELSGESRRRPDIR